MKFDLPRLAASSLLFHCLATAAGGSSGWCSEHSTGDTVRSTGGRRGSDALHSLERSVEAKRSRLAGLKNEILGLMGLSDGDIELDSPEQVHDYVDDQRRNFFSALEGLGVYPSLDEAARDRLLSMSLGEFRKDLDRRCGEMSGGAEKVYREKISRYAAEKKDLEREIKVLTVSLRRCDEKLRKYGEKLEGADCSSTRARCDRFAKSPLCRALLDTRRISDLYVDYLDVKEDLEKGEANLGRGSAPRKRRGCREQSSATGSLPSNPDSDGQGSSSSSLLSKSLLSGSEEAESGREERGAACPRPAGMENMGNICFLNATVQCLLSIPMFVGYIESGRFSADRHPVSCAMRDLVSGYRASTTFSASDGFIKAIRGAIRLFPSSGRRHQPQQDAHDFLTQLLDALISEEERDGGSTELRAMFSVLTDNTYECRRCKRRTGKPDEHQILQLPLGRSVESSLTRYFTRPETAGPRKSECEECKRAGRRAGFRIRHQIERASDYIIIHLLRFDYDVAKGRSVKKHGDVRVSDEIEVNGERYASVGVVCHRGASADSGHYFSEGVRGARWYEFNDEAVAAGSGNYELSQPYILFYARKKKD